MILHKTKENRYRHYKGGIYYKIAECIIGDRYNEIDNDVEVVGEAKYEPTGERMLILKSKSSKDNDYPYTVAFADRELIEMEDLDKLYLEAAILYQSEDTQTNWVRLKDEWEGFSNGVKRFTLANL